MMSLTILKVIVSGLVIGLISELAKKNPAIGGWVAALPIISLLSASWLFLDKSGNDSISSFLLGVMRGLIPTAVMLGAMVVCLRNGSRFIPAVIAGVASWAVCTWIARQLAWL